MLKPINSFRGTVLMSNRTKIKSEIWEVIFLEIQNLTANLEKSHVTLVTMLEMTN